MHKDAKFIHETLGALAARVGVSDVSLTGWDVAVSPGKPTQIGLAAEPEIKTVLHFSYALHGHISLSNFRLAIPDCVSMKHVYRGLLELEASHGVKVHLSDDCILESLGLKKDARTLLKELT
jgi:hypothetical protein